jgi:hypothetical protein
MLRGEFAGKNKVEITVKQPTSDDEEPGLLLTGVAAEPQKPQPVGAGNAEET